MTNEISKCVELEKYVTKIILGLGVPVHLGGYRYIVMRRIIVPTYGSFTANQIRHLPYIVSPNVLYITARFFLSY